MTVSPDPQTLARPRPGPARGAVTGLLSAATALGVAQLVAGVIRPQASPVIAVGGAAIDLTPAPVKNFAIATFGSHDKPVLILGILVVFAVLAALIGLAAMRRLGFGLAGLALFAAIGIDAAQTRPGAHPLDALPTVAGAAAGAVTMILLVRAATAATAAGPPAPDAAAPEPSGAAPGPAPAAPRTAGRRQFLTTGSAAVVVTGLSTLAGNVLGARTTASRDRSAVRLPAPAHPAAPLPPGTDLRLPGLSRFVTPNSSFYRVDTALIVPAVAPASWQLRIHGMVEREITLSFRDLLRLPLTETYVTLTCVSNPVAGPYIGNARWLGASLASLLRRARVRPGAEQLLCTSTDGFTSGTPVRAVLDGRDALLAVAMNGAPLPLSHGFPVRMVVPGLYGYVSATKWVTDIKVTTWDDRAYWVERGWSQQAPIKTESRIDVPAQGAGLRSGRTPVAGVAWAQHRGIEAVEVRVGRGPWQQARLAVVPGIDTWRQWVYDWDATPGQHVIAARATDATGYTQTAVASPPEPNGATGYPTISVSVH